jgi:hypothetical protein
VEALLAVLVGLSVSLVLLLAVRHWPHLIVVLWAAVLCLVPYWLGITAKVYLPPATLIAVVVIAAVIPVEGFRFHLADLVPFLLVLGFLIAAAAGTTLVSAGYVLAAEWIPAYVVGRLLGFSVDLRRIYGVFAVMLTIVAVLALVEFATGYNPFVHLVRASDQFSAWGSIQSRGGSLRAEASFGHAIALGATLAFGVPLAIGSRFREGIKVTMVGLLLAATVVTFSRLGMLSAVLGLVLSLVFLRGYLGARTRVALAAVLALGVLAAIPLLNTVFSAAGTEATNSASYRGDLLSTFGSMSPLGLASSFQKTPSGEVYFSNFQSIDSAFILLGLRLGLIPLALVLIALAGAVVVVLRGRATPATIAVVAQIPAWTSVALITQYAAFAWFMVGLAVTSQIVARRPVPVRPADPVEEAAEPPRRQRVWAHAITGSPGS